MSTHRRARPLLLLLLLALASVPPIAIFTALPWLKQQPDEVVFLFGGIASVLTVVASFGLSILHDRKMDEWQRSNARFSTQWGWTVGSCLVALLLALPPFHDVIVSLAAIVTTNPDRELVLITFTAGFMAVVIAQTVCTALLSIGWAFWKSRAARELS